MTNYLLSKDEKAEMMEVFKSIDKNGDGQLSKEELLEGYEKAFGVAITAQEVDDIMNSIDKNKSGFLDYSGKIPIVVGFSMYFLKSDFILTEIKRLSINLLNK